MRLKGVTILKIWISEYFGFFLDFLEYIYRFYSLIQIAKKGFIFHRTRGGHVTCGADMARGTCVDATRHARPRGRAAQAHAAHKWCTGGAVAWQGYTSPRGRPSGTTWRDGWQVKGPRVSRHLLDSWGGNANALRRPRLYTCDFPIFLPCGTMIL